MRRLWTLLTVVGVTLVTAALAAPASAGTITTFDFFRNTNLNSSLYIYRTDTLTGKILNQAYYRGGSGDSTNECYVDHGWLPGGWYSIWGHHNNYDAAKIKGRVWQFQNKQCYNGTWRTELFIHSEETAGQGQTCGTPYDERWCWDNDSDYYSAGCIKISRASPVPTDLGRLHDNWDSWSGLHGSFTLAQRLWVG